MIASLPDEILCIIFNQLEERDVKACQNVCRAWYFLAHLKLLNKIHLYNFDVINRFIASIDSNPNRSYLNAVREISTYTNSDEVDDHHILTKKDIKKLLFRFPNLESATFSVELLQNMTETMCEKLSKRRPGLRFTAISTSIYQSVFCNTMRRLRLLLTSLDLSYIVPEQEEFPNAAGFISLFPRLTHIDSIYDIFSNFESMLPLFRNLPNLTSLSVEVGNDDRGFAERYLARMAKSERDLIVERFSKIHELTMKTYPSCSAHSLKFISKYMTGLQNFHLTVEDLISLDEVSQEEFYDNLLDLICSVETTTIDFNEMPLDLARRYFPTMISKTFPFNLTSNDEHTHVLTVNAFTTSNNFNLPPAITGPIVGSKKTASYWDISISFFYTSDLKDVLESMFKTNVQFKGVNDFRLQLFHRPKHSRAFKEYCSVAYFDIYKGMLKLMPSLRKLTLDVTPNYTEPNSKNKNKHIPCEIMSTQLEEVTICSLDSTRYQSLLDIISFAYPNIKQLKLIYINDPKNPFTGVFNISLSRFSLETFVLDTTAIQRIYAKRKAKHVLKAKFFVVTVEAKVNKLQRQAFIVANDHSSFAVIDKHGLQELFYTRKYIQVRVIINSLKYLKLVKRNAYTLNGEQCKLFRHDLSNKLCIPLDNAE